MSGSGSREWESRSAPGVGVGSLSGSQESQEELGVGDSRRLTVDLVFWGGAQESRSGLGVGVGSGSPGRRRESESGI